MSRRRRFNYNVSFEGKRNDLPGYPPKPWNPLIALIPIMTAGTLGCFSIAFIYIVPPVFSYADQNSTLEIVVLALMTLFTTASGVGMSGAVLFYGYRGYRQRLAKWGREVAVIRKDKIRAWQADLAEWHQSSGRPKQDPERRAGSYDSPDFKLFAARLFSKIGYETEVVGREGDQGVAVRMQNPKGQIEIVQCKQWGKPVGDSEVREFIDSMKSTGAVYGYIFSPSGFTKSAIETARNEKISLADEDSIHRLEEIAQRQVLENTSLESAPKGDWLASE